MSSHKSNDIPEQKKPINLSEEIKNPSMNYDPNAPKLPGDIPEEQKKEIDKTKEKLEHFKKEILKKFPFTLALGITPPQAAERFDEELGLTPEEKKEKPMHIVMVIPEDNYKDIGKLKAEVIKIVKEIKPKLWVNIITPVDLANFSLDSKFDILEALSMSYPLYDKNILSTFRISTIHKSLCLRKFEKYIYSYVIVGSLIRGEGKPTSDIDAFVLIDDTDVKRMSRLELKEKLRGIIYKYVAEATDLAGVKTPLHVQVYLLTEFWEDVKDAAPVIFGMIRDGVPLYDRGGFLPWKLLLKMGKIKPSPEAIDRFMSMGDKTKEVIKQRLLDIVIGDLFWSVSTPTQAVLMLYGIPPPNVPETVREARRILQEKEKLMDKKYIDILENICINYYKGFEHGKVKEVSPMEVDKLMKDAEEYSKKLKEVAAQIEVRAQEKTLMETYDNTFKMLKHLFGEGKSEQELARLFEKELVKKGMTDPKNLHILKEIIDAKKKYKSKKKPGKYEIEDIRKNATLLMNSLIEYGQRRDLVDFRKMQASVICKSGKHFELFLTNPNFILIDNKLKKVTEHKIEDSSQEEFEGILSTQKGKPSRLSDKVLSVLRKEFGEFDISLS